MAQLIEVTTDLGILVLLLSGCLNTLLMQLIEFFFSSAFVNVDFGQPIFKFLLSFFKHPHKILSLLIVQSRVSGLFGSVGAEFG